MKDHPMKNGFDFDEAHKELFQQHRSSVLDRLTNLDVELPKAQGVDLVLLLEDDSILHVLINPAH